MTVIGYCRVSTDKQAERGLSLDAQQKMITAYAKAFDLEPVDIRIEAGESAKDIAGRPVFSALLEEVRSGAVQAVVTCKLDRMFRNTRECLATLDLIREQNVAFHSVQEHLDTASGMGRFFLTMLAAMGELERAQVGERTKAALHAGKCITSGESLLHQHRAKSGELEVGRAPYGYEWDKDEHRLIVQREEALTVESIRAFRAAGNSYLIIANALAQLGVRTRAGGGWCASQLYRICNAAIYGNPVRPISKGA